MTKELKAFKEHFESWCDIKVQLTIEDKRTPHWKRLVFDSMDCDDMEGISNYIHNTFSNKGRYSHKLPTLGVHNGFLCLTVDVAQIKEKILV